ncbi:MAG: AAA family ATPase, partial [Acetobacteraceae bacterium]
MRIESLKIERYGAFEDRTLHFAPTAPLTLVYGPNEAGKSTSLAAVKDFLFGVPERTPKTLLYGAEGLRLTGSLRTADGRLLTLRRRKGRGRTLTDGDGNPVEEAQLARLLGGIAKDRFETFFALDHHDLRSGGADLLTAEGEIGRLIIEAGGGLRSLVRRLERLEAEIDGLFSPRRSTERAFYKALDAFTAADQDVKAGVLSPSQYERLRLVVETAERRRDEVRDEKATAAKALSKAQRNGRVATPFRQLDETRAALASLDNLPQLPDDFDELVAAAKDRLIRTREAAAQTRGRAKGLATRLAELNIDPAWSAAEAEVLDLTQKRVIVAKQREDRPNRIKELTEAEQKLAELRRRLGAGPEDDLAGRLPPRTDVARVRTLATEAQRREPQLEAATARVKELDAELSKLQERIADAQATARREPLGVTAAEIASLPSAAQAADLRRRQAQTELTRAKDAAIALGLGDLDGLAKTPFPSAQRVTEELRVLEELEAQLRAEAKAAADAEAEQALQAIEAERLSRGGAPATNESVRAAREARGQALEPLREAYRAGTWDTDTDARARGVDKADRAIATADDLADRRAAEAQRAAEHAQALRLSEAAAARKVAARSEIGRLKAVVAERKEALATAFPIASKLYPELRALEDAAHRRETTLTATDEANTQLGQVQAAESLLTGPLELLVHVEQTTGIEPKEGATLADRVRKALAAIAAHEEAHADFRRDLVKLEKDRIELQGAKDRLDALKAAEIDWNSIWVVALPKLGLHLKISLDDAAAAAMEWAAAEGILTTLATTRRRLDRMDEDEADIIRRADALGQKLGLQLPEDAFAKVELLQRRWSDHQAKLTKREALADELQQHQQDATDSDAAAEKAAAVFEELSHQAGVP